MAFDPSDWEIVDDGASSAPARASAPSRGFDPSDWEVVDEEPSFASQLGDRFVSGVTSIPSALADTGRGIWKFVQHPIDTLSDTGVERTARTVGGLSGGAAGGIAGGELGLLGGPLAPLTVPFGAAIGGGLGYLGFNKAADAGSARDISKLEPTREDVLQLAELVGQGLPLGVAGEALSGAARAVPSAFSRAAKSAEGASRSLAADTLAVKPKLFEKSAQRGVQFLDEAGEPVTAANAVDFTTGLGKRVERIQDSPLWNRLGNDPKQNFLEVSKELENLDAAKNGITAKVDSKLNAIGQQYGTRPKLEPDWSLAEDYITRGEGTAGKKPALQRELEAIKADWAAKGGTFEDLINFKGEVSTGKQFAVGPNDAPSVALREKVLTGIRTSAERVADNFTDPGTFAGVNGDINALLSVRNLLATKAVDAPGVVGRLFEPVKSLRGIAGLATTVGTGTALGHPFLGAVPVAADSLISAFPKSSADIFGRGQGLLGLAEKGTRIAGAPVRAIGDTLASPVVIGAVEATPRDEPTGAGPNRPPLLGTLEAKTSQEPSNFKEDNTTIMAPLLDAVKRGSDGSARGLASVFAPASANAKAEGKRPTPAEAQRNAEVGAFADRVVPLLLPAIRQVESSGGKNNLGPETKYGRAKGPYQLLDSTGQFYHRALRLPGEYDPFDERQSKRIAGALLSDLIATYRGDVRKAVLAYNQGQGNVDKGNIGPQGRAYVPKVFAALARQAA